MCELVKDKIDLIDFEFNKPFLKWVGGKTQIISDVVGEFPTVMNNYYEPFLGGGSVLLAVLTLQQHNILTITNKIYAYDYNRELIYLYKNIQQKPKKFINTITKIIDEYNLIEDENIDKDNKDEDNNENIKKNTQPKNIDEAVSSQESYYYWFRQLYNDMTEKDKCSSLGSSYFLFLNKTCFRGVFRLSKTGKFNVPFGHYKNLTIINKNHIKEISNLIKDVEFVHSSFENTLINIHKNNKEDESNFIYLDPPYFPINTSSTPSFVNYTSDGFTLETHKELFNILHKLKKNIKWMMSNSSTEDVINNFSNKKKYSITKILCRRAINSKNPESKVNEVLIKSY